MHYPRVVRTILVMVALAATAAATDPIEDANVRAVLERISAQSMQGHVSFLASDLLEGRGTPSRGLDIAAEYIAAQFRRAGLEPAGDNGYFQTAKYLTFEADKTGTKLELNAGGKRIPASPESLDIQTAGPVSLTDAPLLKFDAGDATSAEKLKHEDVRDKVVAIYLEGFNRDAFRLYGTLRRLHPALLIVAGSGAPPQRRVRLIAADQRDAETAVIIVRAGQFADAIEHAKPGATKLTVVVPAPKERPVTLSNVAGLLRGSDPVLKDSYVLVTGHYDHMGMKSEGEGDRIFNGANDDASGTASVMEIAGALAAMSPRPKRSIVFMALFGEELGLVGSQYYGHHPLFPLAKTVADINLEQLGRTDSSDGPQIAAASFTGYDYSGVPAVFAKAGERVGVRVYKDSKRSDPFFARSDNQALADLGVPAHTLCVAFEYPDYHAVGDEWQKLDYDNMAKVDRMVALGLIMLADMNTPPAWNEEDAKAKRYVDVWRTLHAVGTH